MDNAVASKFSVFDIFKLIFAIAVVAIHTDPLVKMKGNFVYKVYQAFIYLAVPFFLRHQVF